MRKLFISLVTIAVAVAASAIVVDNVAGSLETQITDHEVVELSVTGTIDARDFRFIADSLTTLKRLDLSQAQIVAYSDSIKPLSGTFFSFAANELPATMLMGSEIDSLALPQSLTSIGHAALAGCTALTTLVLPETLTTIGSYAFSSSGLTHMDVPTSVATVGEGAWAQCHALTSITLNTPHIPDLAFAGDTLLSNVALGEQVIGIGKGAFNGCVVLDSIKMDAGNNITTLGAQAFVGASAQGINLSTFGTLKEIGPWAFASSGLKGANLPANVNSLGEGAFMAADSLQQALLPIGITSIPAYAFAGNSSLTTTLLPEGVESMGDYAFYNNDSTQVFTLPSTVTHMGHWAMAGMTSLDTINAMPTIVPELGDSVWAGVQQHTVMLNTTGNDIATLYAAAPQWKEFHILRDYLLGDVNLDGYIDIDDVNAIVSYMFNEDVNPFSLEAANVNGDAVVDIDDINAVINIILNGTEEYVRKTGNKIRL